MAKRQKKPRSPEEYERLREASGWWLAAWRDYRGLSQTDLGAEMDTTKGVISDLETGAPRSNGMLAQRYSPPRVEAAARALGVPQGWLFDVNPWAQDAREMAVNTSFKLLDDNAKEAVADLVEKLKRRSAA